MTEEKSNTQPSPDDAPKKPGRPPGSKNKVGRSEKAFIEELLADTEEQYKNAFMRLANADDVVSQRRFMAIRQEMSKMVVPRPTEIDISSSNKEVDRITVLFSSYDDDEEDD